MFECFDNNKVRSMKIKREQWCTQIDIGPHLKLHIRYGTYSCYSHRVISPQPYESASSRSMGGMDH